MQFATGIGLRVKTTLPPQVLNLGFYVEKQRSARTFFFFFIESSLSLDLSGKAEASSAGEQLARINLFDWNGQKRLG